MVTYYNYYKKKILFKYLSKTSKKLAVVLVIFMSMTEIKKKTTLSFVYILYIYHSVYFKKDHAKIYALLDYDNKINTIILIYTLNLGLRIFLTNIKTQKLIILFSKHFQ